MQTIYLDISNKGVVPTIYAKQEDVGRKFRVVFTDSGLPYQIPSDALLSVWYSGDSGEGNYTEIDGKSAFDVDNNSVEVEMVAQMLSAAGCGKLCLVLSNNGSQIGSWNIPYICEKKPGANSEAVKDYYTAFSEVIEAARKFTIDDTLTKSGSPADAAATGEQIALERARIDSFAQLKEGSTTGDAELIDGRTDYEGHAYANIGSHIRAIGQKVKQVEERGVDEYGSLALAGHELDGVILEAGYAEDIPFLDLFGSRGDEAVLLRHIKTPIQAEDASNKGYVDSATANAVTFTKKTLTPAQQAQARANIGAVGNDELGMQHLVTNASKNLIDMNAVTTGGWYYNGKFEMYPDNQYIQNYCFTDYLPVVGGKKYVFSNCDGFVDVDRLMSFAYLDKDKNFISYTSRLGSPAVDYYVFDVPEGVSYIIINSNKYSKFLASKPQLEKGEIPTEYEEYFAGEETEKYYLSNLIVKAEQIEKDESETEDGTAIELSLPNSYELVVGDTFELFWNGIIKCHNADNYYIEAVCGKGKPFRKRFIYTPAAGDVGNHTLTISVYDNAHTLLASGETILSVKSKASSPTTEKVVLYVGDSLANSGRVPDEFHRRLTATDGTPVGDGLSNISFIGTCLSTTNQVPYEGYGGWTFNSYNTENKSNGFMWITAISHGKTADDQHSEYADTNGNKWKIETVEDGRIKMIRTSASGTLPASGTLTWVSGGVNTANIVYTASEQAAGNPFWNEATNAVDFLNYVQACGKTSLDYLYVLLGWNDTAKTEDEIRSNASTFIDNVHASFPNCQVVLLGLEMPSFDGLAANYGAKANWAYYSTMNHVIRLNRLYEEIANETENVSFVQISGQFDTEHNMQTSTRTVNLRNSTTETYQSNGIHPATNGYYQIADACYRDFVHKIQQ